jgi:hypothetical protein
MARYEIYESITTQIAAISIESKSSFVIGIDFGTTYTGVAYAHSGHVLSGDATKVAENVQVIMSWPGSNLGSYLEKTPSVIAYNTSPPAWGGSVKSRDEPQVAHFKLGLQPDAGEHYYSRSSRAASDRLSTLAFLQPNWKHPRLPHKTALDFAVDYLTCVHKYVMEVFFPQKFGSVFLRNQQISYVITVPAIWKDSAKALTRQAAVRAGIPDAKLELITEPEAAALYCATICEEVDLRDGDHFLVCDAGGGTVVSSINSYILMVGFDLLHGSYA